MKFNSVRSRLPAASLYFSIEGLLTGISHRARDGSAQVLLGPAVTGNFQHLIRDVRLVAQMMRTDNQEELPKQIVIVDATVHEVKILHM